MIYDIKTYGNSCLREKAERVEKIDVEVLQILDNMVETMQKIKGVGLAAPQVGINKRMFVIDVGDNKIRKVINPEILELSDEIEINEEGCLSIPGVFKSVKRASRVKIKYLNEKGEEIIEEAEEFLARAFQHEYDHLEGVLFVDRLSPVAKRMVSKKLQLLKKEVERLTTMNVQEVSVLAKGIIDNSINFTVSIIGALTIIITLGIIVFFFSNDRDKIQNTMLALFPPTIRDNAKKTMNELETKVGGYVTAQVLSIMQVGIVTAAGLMILIVEYAIFLGLIAAIMDLVPIVGPIVTFGLIILVSYPKGLLICILSCLVLIIAQTIENNWAKPYFFSKYMDMHPLIVIFSFLVAAKFLGVIGVILAPAIAAVIVALFKEIYIKPMNEEDVNE